MKEGAMRSRVGRPGKEPKMRSKWWRFMLAGVLIFSVTAPNVSDAAPVGKRLWECSWDMNNTFRFRSLPGLGNDSASIIGEKGLCTLRIGLPIRALEEHTASLSASWQETGGQYENRLHLGTCDKDPDPYSQLPFPPSPIPLNIPTETFLQTWDVADAILRLDPEEPGERMIRFKIVFRDTPFPGPTVQRATFVPFPGRSTSNEQLSFETRIGGRCPPEGNFAANYRLFFWER